MGNGRIWIKDPVAILANGAERGFVVSGSRIVELVPAGGEPSVPAAEVVDASNYVVTPGLVNTHHHFYSNLTRAHPVAMGKTLFPWLQALYPIWSAKLNPHNFRLATRVALTELLMSGCTTAADHHAMFAVGLENAMDIQAEEANRLGMRMTLTRGARDLSTKDGQLAPPNVVQSIDAIISDSERVIDLYHDTSDGAMLQVAVAPESPLAVSKDLMRETLALSHRSGCRLHIHLAELPVQVEQCLARHGCRLAEYLDELGWLSDKLWLAHAIHLSDSEIALLGRHGVGVCHCPTSNMMVGSGQCRTLELEAAGSPIGLGADASAANDHSNLMDQLRQAMLLNRLTYDPGSMSHLDAFRWGTTGSARCLGRHDIGEIAVGKQADFACWRLDDLRFSGAVDPLAALVYCAAWNAERVMIAGRWRVEDGVPVGTDLGKLKAEHSEASKAFLSSL